MCIRYIGSALVTVLLFCVCSRPSDERTDLASDAAAILTNLLVSEKTFLSIQEGAAFDTVTNMLGSTKRHGFTIAETNGAYILINCLVAVGAGVDFSLLFRDKTLVKVLELPPGEMEAVPYRGTTWSRPKSWDIDDKTYIEKTINVPPMNRDQIKAHLDSLRLDKRTRGEPANIMPAFLLTHYLERTWPQAKKNYETNHELRMRYDGCRANLGMTVEQVDALYGKPLHVFTTRHGWPARIYGDTRHLDINPLYRFSCIAVVFDAEGRVTNIYGEGFFNGDWEPVLKQRKDADLRK
jgi:hypothetical protein